MRETARIFASTVLARDKPAWRLPPRPSPFFLHALAASTVSPAPSAPKLPLPVTPEFHGAGYRLGEPARSSVLNREQAPATSVDVLSENFARRLSGARFEHRRPNAEAPSRYARERSIAANAIRRGSRDPDPRAIFTSQSVNASRHSFDQPAAAHRQAQPP